MTKFVSSVAGLFIAGVCCWACQSDEAAVKQAENEVFAIHDEVMPKRDELLKLRKQLNQRISSLDSTTSTGSTAGALRTDEEKEQTRLLSRNLTNADSLMMDWMHRYNGDTLTKLPPADALRYLSDQKDQINDVKTKLNTSVEQARQFLGKNNGYFFLSALFLLLTGCGSADEKLPILGQREAVTKVVNGKSVLDSTYQTIPDFAFVSQYGDTVTAQALTNKIYVADFFFTSCPTICPKMKVQLKRVYERFKGNPTVMLLSHTIDPDHDSVPVLKEFAGNLGVTGRQWLFVTGDRDKIYDIGQNSYMVTAQADSTAPGGVMHSGAFILVDKAKHIRGIYDGTTEAGVDKLMDDIDRLLAESES